MLYKKIHPFFYTQVVSSHASYINSTQYRTHRDSAKDIPATLPAFGNTWTVSHLSEMFLKII